MSLLIFLLGNFKRYVVASLEIALWVLELFQVRWVLTFGIRFLVRIKANLYYMFLISK